MDYSRHIGTIFDAQRMCSLNAVVAGAGALGNEVCRILGLLGVGRVLLIDPDRVESSNLTRSVLFRLEDFTGRNKAEALAHASGHVFPDTRWDYLPVAMADVPLGYLSEANVIFGCVDSDLARIEIAISALRMGVPVVDGGLGAKGDAAGRVSVYPGRDHACYVCQLMPQVRARLLGEHFQKRYSCAEGSNPAAQPIPSTPALASIVGALQVDRAVRLLRLPETEHASTALGLRLDGEPEMTPLCVNRDPLCPFHASPGVPIAVEWHGARFIDILRALDIPGATLMLNWPVCVLAVCRSCGGKWAPKLRLGRFRSEGRCPRCGSGGGLPLETISSVDSNSPFAGETLEAFGLGDREILFANPPGSDSSGASGGRAGPQRRQV